MGADARHGARSRRGSPARPSAASAPRPRLDESPWDRFKRGFLRWWHGAAKPRAPRREGLTGIQGVWWRLTRSPDPTWKAARGAILVGLALLLLLGGLWGWTATPVGDSPAYIIQSGSMMHARTLYGRIGTIDPGDVVFVKRLPIDLDDLDQTDAERNAIARELVRTSQDRESPTRHGAKGDVILYHVDGERQNPAIVHRAVAWVEVHPPTAGRFNNTFSVPEYGLERVEEIHIPELGLIHWRPTNSGFITQGDNPRTNNLADQALGITNRPVRPHWIAGTVRGEIPWAGLVQLAINGQDYRTLSPDDDWCRFLNGQAPCDLWVMFFISTGVLVAVPFALAGIRLAKRRWVDKLQW